MADLFKTLAQVHVIYLCYFLRQTSDTPLFKALDYAVKEQMLFRNPAKDVELPSVGKYMGNVYDQMTIMKLLKAVKDTEMELPIALAGLSGLRRGEVAGLKWSDVDFNSCIITVRKQRTAKGSGTKRSRVKTVDSYRVIRVTNSLLEMLKRHKDIQNNNKLALGDEYTDNDFVCCEPDGSVINPSNFSKRFTGVLEKYKFMTHIKFHDLRHSFAANMIRIGVPINTVSKMLGHSSVTITLDIYAHVLDEMQQEAVGKLDADISKYIDMQEETIDIQEDNKVEEATCLYLVS